MEQAILILTYFDPFWECELTSPKLKDDAKNSNLVATAELRGKIIHVRYSVHTCFGDCSIVQSHSIHVWHISLHLP